MLDFINDGYSSSKYDQTNIVLIRLTVFKHIKENCYASSETSITNILVDIVYIQGIILLIQ